MGRPTSPRVSEVVDEYLVVRAAMNKAPTTLTQERSILGRFARGVAAKQDPLMTNITVQHVQDWFYGPKGIMAKGASPSTHNNMLIKVRGLFTFAHARGYCKSQLITPYNGFVRQKYIPGDKYRPNPWVLQEMLDSAEDPMHRFFMALAINTLGRSSELTRLTVGDIDLEAGFISYTVYKTKQTDRFPITADLDAEIRRWVEIYAKGIHRPLHDDDLLVPSRVAGRVGRMKPWRHNKVPVFEYEYRPDLPLAKPHRIVQKALIATGRDAVRGEGTHTIRRAMARALFDRLTIDKGYEGALETVSAMLHHTSVTMTERYLGVEARKMKRNAVLKGQPLLSDMVKEAEVIPLTG